MQSALQLAMRIAAEQPGKEVVTLLTSSTQESKLCWHHALLLTMMAQQLRLEHALASGAAELVPLVNDCNLTVVKKASVQHELLRPERKKKRKSGKLKHKKRRKSKHRRDLSEEPPSDSSLDDLDLGIMNSDNELKPSSDVWQVQTPGGASMLVPLESLPHIALYHFLQTWHTGSA